MKFFNKDEWIMAIFAFVIAFFMLLGMGDILAQEVDVKLHTEAWWVGGLTNKDGEYSYWVVEWTGLDAEGNIHRRREQVMMPKGSSEIEATLQGFRQLTRKLLDGDETVRGFLEAVQNGQTHRRELQ